MKTIFISRSTIAVREATRSDVMTRHSRVTNSKRHRISHKTSIIRGQWKGTAYLLHTAATTMPSRQDWPWTVFNCINKVTKTIVDIVALRVGHCVRSEGWQLANWQVLCISTKTCEWTRNPTSDIATRDALFNRSITNIKRVLIALRLYSMFLLDIRRVSCVNAVINYTNKQELFINARS